MPATLVAKFPLAEPERRSGFREAATADPARARAYMESCAREVTFYRLAASRNSNLPRAVFAEADVEAGWILLLMEDLSHGEPGDAVRGCSPAQVGLVLDEIAMVHAAWWDDPVLERWDWLPSWGAGVSTWAGRFRERVEPFLDRYGDRVPTNVHKIMLRFAERFEEVLGPLAEAPATVVHGDLHLHNVMFVADQGTPTARIIDWQSVSRGPVAIDVALFLVGSLDVASRRAAEFELLRRYHQVLTGAGVHEYGFDLLLDHYRRALLQQLAGTVGWLARSSPDDLQGAERELVEGIFTKGQLFAALIDHREALAPLLGGRVA